MSAKLRHIAIVSDRPKLLAGFYRELFGSRVSGESSPGGSSTVSDGYVGLNINYRSPGRQAGLDHFGFEVEDVEAVFERLRSLYPSVEVLKRPGNRPFAGISTHDPAGNVFDLSQRDMSNRRGLYTEDIREQDRRVEHLVLRTVDPDGVARFYVDVFDLMELERPPSDPSLYLSDGRVTLVVSPWKISDFEGAGIERPALDHLGFKVESVEAFQGELTALAQRDPELAPKPWKPGGEGDVRRSLLSQCSNGQLQICDPDGVLLDVTERAYL